MKKLSTLIICALFAMTSCTSDSVQGPPGPQGPEGPSGVNGYIGTAIDLPGDFTAANDYTLSLFFDDEGVEVFESDAVLVYVKVGDGNDDANGVPIEIFRALPQTYFQGDKTVQYNFDFTYEDVFIFLDGINSDGSALNYAALNSEFRLNQKFRIIVVPAAFAENRKQLDLTNMNAVMKELNIREADVIKK
ncbi:hypothetical protein BC962_3174 [Gillisia mitskevichiae]|uniref:Collagen triple helix repeat protein n=1 Tax=Gillisia mitskevichiae TaxID=270921 RepID=A0A495NXX5_9FLAO|nr:collagen-like protein [Gillisia mitskevichiae]RKS42716.1 hypothetical protein BC962_3174 [Gillisia mitskevichiae]